MLRQKTKFAPFVSTHETGPVPGTQSFEISARMRVMHLIRMHDTWRCRLLPTRLSLGGMRPDRGFYLIIYATRRSFLPLSTNGLSFDTLLLGFKKINKLLQRMKLILRGEIREFFVPSILKIGGEQPY